MPMPISNMEEYDKVINVSWFTPEKEREELTSVNDLNGMWMLLTHTQIPMRSSLLPDVSSLLHRYPKFPEPILLFFG